MKRNKICKQIVIYLCCTVLLTSSVFMSYTIPVYANTNYEDLLKDAVDIALAAAGIYVVVQSGGTLAPLIIPYIETLAGTGFDVYDYVTQDEEAGTTTISADFVNLVLQAYKEYKKDNGEKFDGVMNPGADGYYHFDSIEFTCFFSPNNTSNYVYTFTDINTNYPCAVIAYSNVKNKDGFPIFYATLVFYDKIADIFYSVYNLSGCIPPSEEQYLSDFGQIISGMLYFNEPNYILKHTYDGRTYTGTAPVGIGSQGGMNNSSYMSVSSSSLPVYNTLSSLKEGLRTGDFSAAYNYMKPVSEIETPSYTGEYNGGDITVLTASLDALREKIAELEKSNKSLEEKLKELLEYLKLIGGGTGGGTGGGDVNVDIDLSTTNGLLSKILAKVTQIFDRISETAEGVSDSVHAKMQETLDEMLVQIKKLKHWTMADTAVNAAGAVADWLDFLKGIFDDMENGAGTAVSAISSSMESATGLLKTKFPFCIPWDVAFLVTFLAHEPETPVFKLPIHLERVGIDEYIEVDMSEFSGISTISRTILMLIYCYGLLNLTMKIIPVAKEGT